GRRKLAARAAHGIGKSLLGGSKKTPCFSVGIGCNYIHANHGIRPLKLGGRLELPAINLERQHERVGSEVGSEGIGQAELGGKLRAKETGAKNPDRNVKACAGNSLNRLSGLQRAQKRLKLTDIIGETIGAAGIAAKSTQGSLIS